MVVESVGMEIIDDPRMKTVDHIFEKLNPMTIWDLIIR
jgi:hypothetical protein